MLKTFFIKIYNLLDRHRWAYWTTLVLLAALSVVAMSRLSFEEDMGAFFPDKGDNRRVNYAYQHLGSDNRIIVSITGDSIEMMEDFAEALAERLTDTSLIKGLRYKVEPAEQIEVASFIVSHMPYFLEPEDYVRMEMMMDPQAIDHQIEADRGLLASPIAVMRPVVQGDPMMFSSGVLQNLQGFKAGDQFQTIDDYLFNQAGTELTFIVLSRFPASETKHNGQLLKSLSQHVEGLEEEFDHQVSASLFGASPVAQTNASQIKRDSALAIILSLILVVVVLFRYYRTGRSIFFILLSTLFGGIIALGIIALVKPTVSVVAVGVASIIFGIAVNYPIHFLSQYKYGTDKVRILKDIVNPLLIGNITTVAAFLSLMFISASAMKDLGLFAALLLVGTILFVLIFLPHLLRKPFQSEARPLFRHIGEWRPEKHPIVAGVLVLVTIVLSLFSSRAGFQTDMHAINYMTDEQRDYFAALTDTSVATVYCVSEGASLDDALSRNEKAQRHIDSLGVESHGVGRFLPCQSTQEARLEQWNTFWDKHQEAFLLQFQQACQHQKFSPEAFAPFLQTLHQQHTPITPADFGPIINELASSYIVETDEGWMVYNFLTVEKGREAEVTAALNAIDPAIFAFGDQSVASRMVEALQGDFDWVLYICGFIVFLFLLISFGRLELALIAFLPLAIAWIWILGIMGLLGIEFNIINIILATFIFGMGDDYSIFVTEGTMEEYRTGRPMLARYKSSIFLSATIMFISIGMLILAKHPAMRSLAEVTIIGMMSVVLVAYIVPPTLFRWLTQKKGQLRQRPVTIWTLLKMTFCIAVFFTGVLLMTLLGFFMVTLHVGGRECYRRCLHRVMQALAWLMPEVKCKVRNTSSEDFSRPSIMVSNHQSHFDLLYTLMLHPRIVAVTNMRVWRSPFYGWVTRYADFIPTDGPMEQWLPKVKSYTDRGYSVLIFPEGTRSPQCDILRFHKGAFELAGQLGVDVLPIVLHGVGHVLPKEEFLLRAGQVTIDILPRISFAGETAREMTQRVHRLYVEHYDRMRREMETPSYWRSTVRANYLFKGTAVARQCRRQLQQDLSWIEALPYEGTYTIDHCGQGELALLAALCRPQLSITATDPDPEMIALAQHCAIKPKNLSFKCSTSLS